ncbi:hypothetical protein PS3A_14290 [Pseudomonas sp. 3A(2025)]
MGTDFEPEHEHLLDHEFAADDLDDEEHEEADSFLDDEYDD